MIIDAWMQHPTGDPFYRRLVVTALLHRSILGDEEENNAPDRCGYGSYERCINSFTF